MNFLISNLNLTLRPDDISGSREDVFDSWLYSVRGTLADRPEFFPQEKGVIARILLVCLGLGPRDLGSCVSMWSSRVQGSQYSASAASRSQAKVVLVVGV